MLVRKTFNASTKIYWTFVVTTSLSVKPIILVPTFFDAHSPVTADTINDINEELMMAVNVLDKKMETLLTEPLVKITSANGLGAGELLEKEGRITIPSGIAEKTFGLSISMFDLKKRETLYYKPEYLIYKRTDS